MDEQTGNSQSESLWAAGEYALIGAKLVIVGELLCEAVDLRAGQRVLDVATGDGNTALAAARRGCDVTGVDFTPSLLERARRRATAEGLQVTFRPGEAEDLPFGDATFDAVLSTFGVMFAPDARGAARELLRVCRPGGKIGLANWTSTGANLAEGAAFARHFPPPPNAEPSPWVSKDGLRTLFGRQAAKLETTRRSVTYRFRSIEDYLDTVFAALGPLRKRVESLTGEAQAGLRADWVEALRPFNRSGDDTMVLPFDYLEAIIVKAAK